MPGGLSGAEHLFGKGVTFIGLIGMPNSPCAEVKQAVETSRMAGIRLVMITGYRVLGLEY
ncbi:MAG: hypothetical protein ABFS17_08415 [Chloroflexota bacterium]